MHSKRAAVRKEFLYLAAVLVFGIALSFLLFKGLSFYGDDTSYVQYVPSILNGTFKESINIFSIRLLMNIPLALSVALFGYTDLGAGFWALLSYAITIALTYFIGKELYDSRAGLISALLFAIYPLCLHFNTSPDPMMPLAMFTAASLLFFMRGRKEKSVGSYLLAGAFVFLGALVNPLAYLYFLFYAFFMVASAAYDSVKAGKFTFDYSMLAIFVGLLTAVAVMGYINTGLTQNGSPFFELSMTNNYYSAAGGPDQIFYTNPSLTFYLNGYFPYNFSGNVLLPLLSLNPVGAASGVARIANLMFSLQTPNLNEVGLFGYAMVLAELYLLAKRDKRSYFSLLLASFLVLYMEFGSMSITHYFPIYKLMRFTAVASVPLMLVLGIALASFAWDKRSNAKTFNFRIAVCVSIILLLFVTSLSIDYYYYALNHNSMIYVMLMTHALKAAPRIVANVSGPAEIPYYLSYYMGYPRGVTFHQYDNGAYGGLFLPTCASIPNNTYLIIPSPSALQLINSYNLWSVNESWAFNPSICNLQLYADIYDNASVRGLGIYDLGYTGNIYYKTG